MRFWSRYVIFVSFLVLFVLSLVFAFVFLYLVLFYAVITMMKEHDTRSG